MSVSSIETILERTTVATPESPLAVFRVGSAGAKLDCIFGATLSAKERIKDSKSFIMLIHRDMDKQGVKKILVSVMGHSR